MKTKIYILKSLLLAALCSSVFTQAKAAEPKLGQEVEIIKPFVSDNFKKTKFEFNVPSFGIEHQVRLSMEVCAPYKKYKAGAGSNPVLGVIVNGNSIAKKQLLNKDPSFRYMDRYELTWDKGVMWRVLYAQNFEIVKDYKSQYPNDPNPYKYVFDITKFVKPGKNEIVFNYMHVYKTIKLKVRNVKVVVDRTFMNPVRNNKVIPAPTGKIPAIALRGKKNEAFKTFLSKGGAISVALDGKKYNFYTRTTVPGGSWKATVVDKAGQYIGKNKNSFANWETTHYKVQRQVEVKNDHIMVSDKITNTSKELLGMYLENWTDHKDAKAKYILGGHNIKGNASQAECENPSAIVETKAGSIGMVPESDIFQAHIYVFRDGDKIGLKDVNLAIQTGKSVTMKWGIYPVSKGNYWDVVNSIRRNWGVNLKIPGPFAFQVFGRQKKTDADYVKWIKMRNLTMVCDSIPSYNGDMVVKLAKKYGDKGRFTKWAHGTAAPKATVFVKNVKRINKYFKKNIPDFNYFCYFHIQVSTLEGGHELYDDSVARDARGNPYYYSSKCLKIYVPTLTSKYGKAIWEYVKLIVDKDKLDMNMYWDEESYSMHRFVYSKQWDGNSIVLNRKTFKVARKITCVPLVTQALKLEITKYVKGKGKMMLANSQAITPTMRAQKILRFAETGSYDNMYKTNLGCIVGLGTHNYETNAEGTFDQFYQILLRGGIQYSDWSIPNEAVPKNYFPQYMFPLTPVEIFAGTIFAKERIVTCKSGIYTLPGNSRAKIIAINSKGLVVDHKKLVKEKKIGNKFKYEVRIPSNCIVVLIKKS